MVDSTNIYSSSLGTENMRDATVSIQCVPDIYLETGTMYFMKIQM